MKKLITPLIFISLFLIAGVVAFAVLNHRNQYVTVQTASENEERQKQEDATKAQIETMKAERTKFVEQYNALRGECAKGQTAFTRLSLANQRAIGTINCGEVAR